MKKKIFNLVLSICVVFISTTLMFAQEIDEKKYNGQMSFGMRSTMSTFGQSGYNGYGYGGQARFRFARKVNTDWFADYITTGIGDLGKRTDAHIGWSVLFYPVDKMIDEGVVLPFILAGHCFDYTEVGGFEKLYSPTGLETKKARWSSAIQCGLGSHFRLNDKTDVTLMAQYMNHLGNDIHYEIEGTELPYLIIDSSHEGVALEGHILLTMSLNIILADLW